MTITALIVLSIVLGCVVVVLAFLLIGQRRIAIEERRVAAIRQAVAQEQQQRLAVLEARHANFDAAQEDLTRERRAFSAECSAEQERQRILRDAAEQRMHDREERLASSRDQLTVDRQRLQDAQAELKAEQSRLQVREKNLANEVARVAGLTREEAKAEIIAGVEHEARLQAANLTREIESEARKKAEDWARRVIVVAIQRLATEQTTESVISTVPLPSDDMKGRIIGREGRNIRAFEQTTGVNVLIDDTPESVVLSSFDPVRRETARMTLEELVADGRIHPARIEEVYERCQRRIKDVCLHAAEEAAAEVGITDLHPDLMALVGTLKYRTSYGQNVLKHLVETSHLAGLMAAELGLDADQCRRAAFLHDIGKAVTHEVEGSHAMIGADIARKYGENSDVVHAIAAHHNEVEAETLEAVLTQSADAISGGRPGARRESLEAYVRRLERLEDIAQSRSGVDKVFAMQAGREIRVMVSPTTVDDGQAHDIARDIARAISDELTFPGTIKVTVVRESRATEYAH